MQISLYPAHIIPITSASTPGDTFQVDNRGWRNGDQTRELLLAVLEGKAVATTELRRLGLYEKEEGQEQYRDKLNPV